EYRAVIEGVLQVIRQEYRQRVQVIERNVEEALNLAGVQIHAHDARDAGGHEQIGHQLRRDRRARRDLAILAGVTVVRNDGGDRSRRRAAQGVAHDEQLHQVVVHGRRRGLDDVDVQAAHVLADLHERLRVTEARYARLTQRSIENLCDLAR